jgi:three-Cys-motif partner protein
MQHHFGGPWTAQKLQLLEKYLGFFSDALKDRFGRLVYIDTFAGTGQCTIVNRNGRETIDGSAAIALGIPRPFDHYYFIERKVRHVRALEQLRINSGPLAARVTIEAGDAASKLAGVLQREDWNNTRGVLFLDPYGLQCTWEMVQSIARTKALDVFFLVSLSGLSRQAARSATGLTAEKRAALTRFLGTDAWERALYKAPAQDDMFNDSPALVRDRGNAAILQFVGEKMGAEFADVAEPIIFRNRQGAELFALYFAVSNPSKAARTLAKRVHSDILKKMR